jgi:glycosyltransferase involved in cell wall biosynthesis
VIGAKVLGAKTRLVRTFHRLDQFDWKMKPLMPIYRKYTDTFIAISEYMKDYLSQNGFKHKVFVVHNGVKEVQVTAKKKALGFLGRISPEKGIKTFVQKNEKLFTSDPLIIGGDGPEMLELMTFVQKKSLNIKLLGQVTDKDKFFSLFNVLILPSSTEAVPLVVLEAFSVGTPVVAFDIPSLRSLINGMNGKLVKAGDYKLLAKTALELSQGKNYKQFSENAKETFFHRYTIEKMWFDTERLYQKFCK